MKTQTRLNLAFVVCFIAIVSLAFFVINIEVFMLKIAAIILGIMLFFAYSYYYKINKFIAFSEQQKDKEDKNESLQNTF